MSQTWASADFAFQNTHTGGFYCCFLLLAICRQVQKLSFMLRLAFPIMPRHHFSVISNIYRCCAECEFNSRLFMIRKEHYKRKGHTETSYIPWVWGKLSSWGHKFLTASSHVSELPVLPRGTLLVLNCHLWLYRDCSSLVLLCTLIFKRHGPDFQLKWISMPLSEACESALIYTSWRLPSLVTVIRLLLCRSMFATLVYLLHCTL